MKEWLEGQTEDFYFGGINSVPEKCRTCIELSMDCVEKRSVVCNISVLFYGQVAKLFERLVNSKSTTELLHGEQFWTTTLHTKYPHGLNN